MKGGFRKGKIPKRFEVMTDEEIFNLPVQYSSETVLKEIDNQIVAYINTYFDTELAALQIIKKIERLEKALDKACQVLENLDNRSLHYEEKWLRSMGCEDEVEPSMSKEEWKEWCMKDAD